MKARGLAITVSASVVSIVLLFWQNTLILQQNDLFREQNAKQQRQIDQQAYQADLALRAQLISTIFDCDASELQRATRGCSLKAHERSRADAAKALVLLERRLIKTEQDEAGANGVTLPQRRVNLRYADLRHGDFRGVDWHDVDLSYARLDGADFSGANLANADLGSALMAGVLADNTHFEGANLSNAHLEKIKAIGAHFERASAPAVAAEGGAFLNAYLEGATLSHARLEASSFDHAHLEGVDLRDAHLEGARLAEAFLDGADLTGARLGGTELPPPLFENRFAEVPISEPTLRSLLFGLRLMNGRPTNFSNAIAGVVCGQAPLGVNWKVVTTRCDCMKARRQAFLRRIDERKHSLALLC